jgi:dolichyl-phosphate beta-glucosyltransferase
MMLASKTTIVVPCYNEANRLDGPAFERALELDPKLEFLFVDDGSKDDTFGVLQQLAARVPGRITLLRLERNQGKAEAVRRGMLQALQLEPELAGYWDADLATPLPMIAKLAAAFENPNLLVVLGSRVHMLGTNIERKPLRHYIGRAFATLASSLLDMSVYDTQCGAKLFRAGPVARSLFERPFELRWCFDVEILARLIGLEREGAVDVSSQCLEVPLDTWIDVGGSKLNARQVPRVLFEFAKLVPIARAARSGRRRSP